MEIKQNTQHCRDDLFFDYGIHGSALHKHYCGNTQGLEEIWNKDEIRNTNNRDLHVKYKMSNGGAGAKFWLIVEGNVVTLTPSV